MTSALLWSSVRRREEYGTLSNSSSARMSSPSGADRGDIQAESLSVQASLVPFSQALVN